MKTEREKKKTIIGANSNANGTASDKLTNANALHSRLSERSN